MSHRSATSADGPAEAGAAVVVEHLTKRFGRTVALDDLSFSVGGGELFGFIGPDGAGKTTLFRTLATLMLPDAGRARVLGLDVVTDLWRLRTRIGYMPGRFSLYPDLSVDENLRFFASVFGVPRGREREHIAPIYAQLEPFKNRRAAALSGGMKQKLALCCALVHHPHILLLDEPTRGVDAVSRREFWDLLGTFTAAGTTILVSTPYMDEANRCHRIALVQGGRLLGVDTPAAIAGSFDRPLFSVKTDDRYRALLTVRRWGHAHAVYPFGDALHYADARLDTSPTGIAAELAAFLAAEGLARAAIEQIAPTVEDVFIARMGTPEGLHAA